MKKFFLSAMLCIVSALGMNAQTWTASEVGTGSFMLYNVGKGQFLVNGNGWGTQASVSANSALTVILEEYNGAYKLRTNMNGDGKGLERLSDPVIFTDQSAGKNSTWTFTKVADASNGPVYTIVSKDNHGGGSGSYMTASADNTIVGPADNVTDDYGRWQLVQSWITNTTPVSDANGWTTSQTPTFDRSNVCAEYWNKSGASIKQTLTNLPAGAYELIAVAFTRTGMTATLNAGSNTMSIATASTSEANNRTQANTWFNGGHGVNKLEFTHAGGNLEIGLTADNSTGDHWLVWRSFVLLYKGLDLSELKAALQAQIDAVPSLENTTTTATYNAAKNYADGIDMDALTTAEAISTASTELAALVDAAKALQPNYARYQTVKTAAKAISDNLNTTSADNAVDAATTNAAIDDAVATLRTAFLTALPNVTIPADPGYIDVTAVMVDNAGVHTNTDYWTAEGTPNTSYSWAVCSYGECEFYQQNFKFYQTLALTPGTWEFGVTGFHRAGNHKTHFYAGVDKILIPGVESSVVNSMAAAKTYFDGGNGKVALKFLIESASDVEIGIDNQDTETDKWTIFRDFTLKYYGAPDYSVYVERWNTAKAAADEAKTNYPNVTGEELTALNTAYANAPVSGDKKAQYIEKCEALESATVAFNAAGPKYNAYVAEKDKAAALGVNVSSYTAATNATDADTKTKALKVAEYNYVNTNYQYGVELGTWTSEGPTGVMTGQHWDNTETSEYLEQSGEAWGQNSWSLKYSQNVTLPAGSYIFKVAGRHSNSNNVQLGLEVTLNGNSLGSVNDFPAGDVGRGIDTTGATNYDDEGTYANSNNGRGWEWRYVKFTLSAQSTVNIAVNASATAAYQWVGFCNATIQTNNEANVTMMAYYVAKNDATTALTNTNVTGSEKTALEEAIAANPGTTTTQIEAATQNLIDKTATFRAAEPAYNSYAAVKALCPATALAYATTAKKNAVAYIVNTDPTSAQDAQTKTTSLTTALRAYYESHALAEGATGVVVNKTNSITNPSAENGINGWTTTVGTRNDQPWTDASNNSTHSYFDGNGKPLNASMEQNITLSAGKYLLTAKGRASAPVTLTLEAGDQSVEMSHVGNQGNVFSNGWGDASVEFTTAGGEVTIKVTATSEDGWFSVSDFRLIQLQSNAQAGDVDGNGTRDINDVEMLVNYLLGKNPVGVANPDTDGDKKVSLKDVTKLVNLIK